MQYLSCGVSIVPMRGKRINMLWLNALMKYQKILVGESKALRKSNNVR